MPSPKPPVMLGRGPSLYASSESDSARITAASGSTIRIRGV